MGYLLVTQVMLDGSGIVALISKIEPSRVSKHVGMDRELYPGFLPCPCHHLPDR